jgi:prolyl oligopeptidase
MKTPINFLVIFVCFMLFGCNHSKMASRTDDPFLWLEDLRSQKSLAWVNDRNKITDSAFTRTALYKTLSGQMLKALDDEDKIAYPDRTGRFIYNFWQDKKHERGIWRRQPFRDYFSEKSNWEVILDIDSLSFAEKKEWVFMGAVWLEPENETCLVRLSEGGGDKSEYREFDAVKKKFKQDGFKIPSAKGEMAWIDKNTLLVSTDFGKGSLTSSGYPRILKKWKRNTPLSQAETIIEADTTIVRVGPFSFYDENRNTVGFVKAVSFFQVEWYCLDEKGYHRINVPLDANFKSFFKNNIFFVLQSDWHINGITYPSGALMCSRVDTDSAKTTLVYQPVEKSSITNINPAKDFQVMTLLENVSSKLVKLSFASNSWITTDMPFPGMGTIIPLGFNYRANDYFFIYNDLITPTTLYYVNNDKRVKIKQEKEYFDSKDYTVKQYWTKSKDSTLIPYFMVCKKNMELNGKNPVLIVAYGGFNLSQLPYYDVISSIGWLAQGGVYVLANIRGGGEFGPQWHLSAVREKRQNAYDDYFAVAEDLINRKVTSPENLGIFGWSNGGLLTGVAFTQRPDLYKAVVIGAPLLDMKRYTKLFAGASWIEEYGDPDKPQDWAYLSKFSPYQNLSKDKKYPEVLFITSINDDRVHPAHARKMAAKMEEMGHPFYYHETLEGGHGAAFTNKESAEMNALIYTYLNMKLMNKK